jgi:hypothetical protein
MAAMVRCRARQWCGPIRIRGALCPIAAVQYRATVECVTWDHPAMNCRQRCGACCIAPSISSPIPGMPTGKPAGVRCIQLDDDERCRLFGHPERPAVCRSLRPEAAMCGGHREQALSTLAWLEAQTLPG